MSPIPGRVESWRSCPLLNEMATTKNPHREIVAKDTKVPGLALRAFPNGEKRYVLYYRNKEGR